MPADRPPQFRRSIANFFTLPVVSVLAKTPVSPDALTWLGFLINLAAAVLIITGHLFAAGFVVLIAGFFDILDGALARRIGKTSPFGGVLDSTLDRLSEAVVLFGILVVYAGEGFIIGILITGVALIGSPLVSYVRARAEAVGIDCQEGLFTRSERVIVIALGLLLSKINYVLITVVAVIAVFSLVTVAQRLFYVWRRMRVK
ncbi:MAG: CDP-alcohol phosphatidyltransferase family protein [Chloroflexota bacterium]